MCILLLTDDETRAERLERALGAPGLVLRVDVRDPVPSLPEDIDVVVSGISFRGSETLAGLRRHLDALGPARPPFLCLLPDASPRSSFQASAFSPDRTFPDPGPGHSLSEAVAGVLPGGTVSPLPRPPAQLARSHFAGILDAGRSGEVVGPEVIAAGASHVEAALRQSDIRSFLEIVWEFDDTTHRHCMLVAGLAAGFGQALGLGRGDCRRLTEAALLHDIGKSRIPIAILNKPGQLDAAERLVMQRHPELGHEMLLAHGGYDAELLAVVRSHHEMLDGSGYPDRLPAKAIPDLVRLVTVCDVFSALIERRPYRAMLGGDEAFSILAGMEGRLDPALVKAFRPVADAVGSVSLSLAS